MDGKELEMKDRKNFAFIFWALALMMAVPGMAFANKAAVSIEAPKAAAKGEEVIIVINVTHDGNSPVHYVNWVNLKINGKDAKKWEYSPTKRPESGNFTLNYKYRVDADTKIAAEANCNLHGSAGPASATIKAKQ